MLKDILQQLYAIDHLPSHPLLIEKLPKGNNVLIEELAGFVVYNPSLTIELLKLANSDSFSFRNKISSLKEALLILDNDLIKLIITQHPVIPRLKEFDDSIQKEFKKLIKHSIEVRLIAENLHKYILKDRFSDLFFIDEFLTASTLHDIGLYFLATYFPNRYSEIKDRIKTGTKVGSKEQESLALPDHSIIGSILCKHWNLPDSIVTSIAFHHYPWLSNKGCLPVADLLYLVDNFSSTHYEIYYDDDDIYTVDEHIIMKKKLLDIVEKYSIDMFELARLRLEAGEQSGEVFSKLGI